MAKHLMGQTRYQPNRSVSQRNYIFPIILVFLIGSILLLTGTDSLRQLRWWERGNRHLPTWSPDGTKILHIFRQKEIYERIVVIDRSGIFKHLDMPVGRVSAPSWRSDREISFFIEKLSGSGTHIRPEPAKMLIYNLETEELKMIEGPLPNVGSVAWNSNGDQALVSFRDLPPFTPVTMQPAIYRFTPSNGKFILWREAEWPAQIAWSPSDRLVAYIDLVKRGDGTDWQLNVINAETGQNLFSKFLSGLTAEFSWTLYGDAGLSWSPDESWLILNGTIIKNPESRFDYDSVRVFAFISVKDPDQILFWELKRTVDEFDLSPDGKKIVAITVVRPWIGGNALVILDVPKEFQIKP